MLDSLIVIKYGVHMGASLTSLKNAVRVCYPRGNYKSALMNLCERYVQQHKSGMLKFFEAKGETFEFMEDFRGADAHTLRVLKSLLKKTNPHDEFFQKDHMFALEVLGIIAKIEKNEEE